MVRWFVAFTTPDKSDDTDLLSKSDQGKVRWNLAHNNQMVGKGFIMKATMFPW